MFTDKPKIILYLSIVYMTAIVTSLMVAFYLMQKLEGSMGIRLGLAAFVIGAVHFFMLIGLMKQKQWGYELIQVMSKFFLIGSGLLVAPVFLSPKSAWPLLFIMIFAFFGYKNSNTNEFKEYFGRDPDPEQLTHL